MSNLSFIELVLRDFAEPTCFDSATAVGDVTSRIVLADIDLSKVIGQSHVSTKTVLRFGLHLVPRTEGLNLQCLKCSKERALL